MKTVCKSIEDGVPTNKEFVLGHIYVPLRKYLQGNFSHIYIYGTTPSSRGLTDLVGGNVHFPLSDNSRPEKWVDVTEMFELIQVKDTAWSSEKTRYSWLNEWLEKHG